MRYKQLPLFTISERTGLTNFQEDFMRRYMEMIHGRYVLRGALEPELVTASEEELPTAYKLMRKGLVAEVDENKFGITDEGINMLRYMTCDEVYTMSDILDFASGRKRPKSPWHPTIIFDTERSCLAPTG